MALQVWLPLNGTLENKGLSNLSFSNTATSAITVDNNGKIGKCYRRATNNSAGKITSNLTINLNGDLSIFCWAKVTSCPGDSANGLVSNHSHANNTGFGITVKQVSTSDFRISCSTGNGSSRTYMTYYGTSNIKDKWCHLGLTYDNTKHEFKLWVNGVCEYTQSYTNASRNDYITIFDWSTTYDSGFKPACYLNDVRVYNHCLSAKEVKEISKGLILHYKLDGNDIGITIPRNGGLIPDGVELYDYIKGDGVSCYIDTGFYPNNNTHIKTNVQIPTIGNGTVNIYAAGGTSYTDRTFELYDWSNKLQFNYGNNTNYLLTPSLNTWLEIEHNKTEVRCNDTIGTVNANTFTSPVTMFLFSTHRSNADPTTFGSRSNVKMQYFTIWDNGVLVRNFLPCTYLGEPGMWDTVENKFYRNQGTGLFTLGNKITLKEYEYLEANKAPYIDTQFIPKGNTSVEMQLMALSSTQNGFFGAYGSGWTDNSYGFYGWSGEKIWNNYKNDVAVGTYTSIFPINTIHKVFKDKNILYINNRLIHQDAYTNFTAPYTLLIFDINKANSRCPAKMRLYYTKVWDNNTLVRDFIPVSYNGTPGLWDKVEWKFYANAGSGTFTLGPEKTVQQDAPVFYDSSGYCNHGSITGTLTTSNNSPRYTKSTQIVSGATISHPLCIKEPEWTCSCWIYPTNLSSYTYLNNLAMGMKITHGTQSLLYINENPAYYRYSHTFELNKWQHIVFVFKHSTRYMAIYKNGVKDIATGPSGGTVPKLSNTITLFTGFTGYVSDYREYSTALSEDDVKELYNTSAFVTNNGVFAEYELYEDNLSDVKKRGLLETANFYENGAESGYALDTDKTRVASNYIISEDFIEI